MSDNSRLTKNTILLYIRMLAVMAVSLYTSRIILQNLGVMDFGLYSVVGGIAITFMFLNTAMNSSTQRYLTIAIGKGEEEELHKIFNISVVIHTLIGLLIIILCEGFGIWFILNKMTIPDGRETAVMWSFQLSLIAAFITIISVPYNALIISRERMGAFAYISIFDVLFKLFIAYIIAVVHFDRLIFYSLLMVLSQILVRFLYTIYCHRNFKECRFKFYRRDKLYKEMTVFASWGLLGHFSWIINTSIQDMMLNVFFTPIVNAARGIAMRVSSSVYSFNDNFQTAVSPQVTKACAVGDRERMFLLIYNSSRFSLFLVWLLSLPVLLSMDDILSLWLTEVPENTSLFLSIILLGNLIRCLGNPLNMAIRANGKIRNPELIGGIIVVMNLPTVYVFLKLGFPAYVVFVIMTFFDIISQCLRIFFSKLYLHMPVRIYLQKVIIHPTVVLLITALCSYMVSLYIHYDNRMMNILILSLISIVMIIFFGYTMGTTKTEKKYILAVAKNRFRR